MCRLAVITDIHGNKYALKAALSAIKRQAVDRIYCLGDMIGMGPFSNEVLETLLDNHVHMVTGNHDEAVLALIQNKPYPKSRDKVKPHHEWIAERIDSSYIKELTRLPRIRKTVILGHALQFIHFPLDEKWYEAPVCEDPFDQAIPPSAETFYDLKGLNDHLICFGHDHDEHQFSLNEQTFFNPGSLGCYHEPFARYGIIEIEEHSFTVTQKYVPYDFVTYLKELEGMSFPRKKVIMKIFQRDVVS